MFEDDPRNLAVPHGLGMRTVLVGPPAAEHPHVHHQTDDLAALPRRRRLMQAGDERIDVLVAGGASPG